MACPVHHLIETQLRRAPDDTAVLDRRTRLTGRELEARANRLAHALIAAGVTPDTPVGVCCERTTEMVVAVLGILKAGGAYVPLDPAHPRPRLELLLDDARLGTVVVDTGDRLAWSPVRKIRTDVAGPVTPPEVDVRPEHAFYVLYTSGSTGTPKGVIGTHDAIARRLAWGQNVYPFAPGEIACARTTLGFVDSVAEIFAPLAYGAPLVVLGDDAQRDPLVMLDELAAYEARRIVLVPSLLATLFDVAELARRVPALTLWFVGGEPVPVALVERFRRAMPGCKLINIYGATELSADATFYDFDRMPAGLASSPIGLPLPGVHARVVDEHLREVPDGEPGEVCISGWCVARGYLGRPELTAERFVESPFPEGGRLYRTGDLGRRLATGDVQYLGRIDQLVKIRGVRVELGEVEALVAAVAGVGQAVSVVHGDALVAYYTGEVLSAADLRAAIASRAPGYLVPAAFVHLAALPRSANGKIDRRVLRERPIAVERGELPASDDERRVAAAWESVLDARPIGRTQSFFDLGGTSLGAMRIVARLRDELGVHLPVAAMFEHPTVAGLAAHLATLRAPRPVRPPAQTGRAVPDVLPLGEFQIPFWFYRALTGGESIVSEVLALEEPIDIERLQTAFSDTVAHIDALWMRYPRWRPVQERGARRPYRFEIVDRRGDPEDHALAEEADRNNVRGFDLAAPPHVHARLVRVASGDRLLLAIPHICIDMTGMELLRRMLEARYASEVIAPPACTLADLLAWQGERRESLADHLAYWATIGAGPATNTLPERLFTRERVRAWSARALPPELAGRLVAYSREHAIGLPMALIGAVYAALGRLAERDDPTLLLMIEKRDRPELRDLVTNLTAPMRVRLPGGARGAVTDVVARVARQLVASYEHTDHLMARPTSWNDFWARAPRPLAWLVEQLSARLAARWGLEPALLARYAFALVPDPRRRELLVVLNILPEVYQPPAGRIVPRRELPHLLRPGDLVTNTDALLDRTLQIHLTRDAERRLVVNLYGGRFGRAGLDEVSDRIIASISELVG